MTEEDLLQKDWYAVLDASPTDCLQVLKQKYQRLALLYHPDKQSPDAAVEQVQQCVQRFIEVDQAWKILGDEQTKRAYDLQRRAGELRQSWPVDAHICLDDMSWDDESVLSMRIDPCEWMNTELPLIASVLTFRGAGLHLQLPLWWFLRPWER
ncbi:dnaJ homolog subfamily C member 24 isoform X2 [Brienomyrus brachyistius]|uniref:dnaJ homolog subfamily C member 24 isoform X2 n=1 Tax=Brienomyrus brachyistius TaxID=42636 RepID=UPI0020B3D487|nr:dnaJ homolog subfamily C member 24 isoform X2 [Brienomyrus brachyistius]